MTHVLDLLWLLPLLGYFGGGLPVHGHSNSGDGGILGPIIGTGQLKTATGSATSALGSDSFTLNDYTFFPSFTNAVNNPFVTFQALADPGNTIGRTGVSSAGGVSTVRWRYLTASDDPHWWVAFDAAGAIVGVWTSDDPPSKDFVGCPLILTDVDGKQRADITYKQITAADLAGLGLPKAATDAADAKIAAEKLDSKNRLYRAMQAHADDPAPSAWLLDNCKIVTGALTPMKALDVAPV